MIASYAYGIVTARIMAWASRAYAQDSNLSVANATVTAPAAPVELYRMRDPWRLMGEILISGRYRVEDKFRHVPCAQTRIALSRARISNSGARVGSRSFRRTDSAVAESFTSNLT